MIRGARENGDRGNRQSDEAALSARLQRLSEKLASNKFADRSSDSSGVDRATIASGYARGFRLSSVAARVAGQSLPPFRYRDQGNLATIGRRAAVVELGHIQLKGFIGWMFWGAVHIYFLIGIRNRFIVAINWLWSYVTFQRGARLITEVPPTVRAE